jgi:opacity protein-like surface antigen
MVDFRHHHPWEAEITMFRRSLVVLALGVAFCSTCWGQSFNSGTGYSFGFEAIYQDSTDISGRAGSTASIDDDLGFALTFGYRFNPNLELEFGLDWASVDYNASVQCADPPCLFDSIDVRGEYEYFTPRVNLNYYINPGGQLVPYIRAGIGYAFIDTNIPTGQVEVGCWWDPFYGQICTGYQDTASLDDFAYQLGIGVLWKFSRGYGLRLGYEKQWIDFGQTSSTPDFDQIRLGIVFMY